MRIEPRVVLNFAVFYAGWFACVLGAAHQLPWLGTLTVIAATALHLWLAPRPRVELLLLVSALLLGTAWDSALVLTGITTYSAGTFMRGVAPHWIIALWVLFATTLNVSLAWLKRSQWLAAVFGGVGGALSFFAGYRLGAVGMPDLARGLIVQGIGWAVLLPVLMRIAQRCNGFANPSLQER